MIVGTINRDACGNRPEKRHMTGCSGLPAGPIHIWRERNRI